MSHTGEGRLANVSRDILNNIFRPVGDILKTFFTIMINYVYIMGPCLLKASESSQNVVLKILAA